MVAEFHLEYLQIVERKNAAAAQGQLAERGLLVIQFLKKTAHASLVTPSGRIAMRLRHVAGVALRAPPVRCGLRPESVR